MISNSNKVKIIIFSYIFLYFLISISIFIYHINKWILGFTALIVVCFSIFLSKKIESEIENEKKENISKFVKRYNYITFVLIMITIFIFNSLERFGLFR